MNTQDKIGLEIVQLAQENDKEELCHKTKGQYTRKDCSQSASNYQGIYQNPEKEQTKRSRKEKKMMHQQKKQEAQRTQSIEEASTP